MALVDWAFNNWYWALGCYALAFGVAVAVGTADYVRTERAKLAEPIALAVADGDDFDATADDYGHANGRALSGYALEARRRAIRTVHARGRVGRHVADGDRVCTDEKAVA